MSFCWACWWHATKINLHDYSCRTHSAPKHSHRKYFILFYCHSNLFTIRSKPIEVISQIFAFNWKTMTVICTAERSLHKKALTPSQRWKTRTHIRVRSVAYYKIKFKPDGNRAKIEREKSTKLQKRFFGFSFVSHWMDGIFNVSCICALAFNLRLFYRMRK